MNEAWHNIKLEKIDDNRWLLPQTGGMKVPGIIYANEKIYQLLKSDEKCPAGGQRRAFAWHR